MASSARIDELRKKFDENPRRYFAPLANEFRKAGDLEQAVFICQEYLPQQPGHMSGHIVYGQTLFELGRDEEAKAVFETALSLDPENLIALRHLGDIARQAGDIDVARFWYQRVLESDPRNDEIAQVLMSIEAAPGESPPPLPEAAPPSPEEPVTASAPEIAPAAQASVERSAASEGGEPAPPVAVPEPESYEPFEGFDRTPDFADQTPSETDDEPESASEAEAAADIPAVADRDAEAEPLAEASSAQPDAEELLELVDFSIGTAAPEPVADEAEAAPEPASAELSDIPADDLSTIELDATESPFDLAPAPEESSEPATASAAVDAVSVEDDALFETEQADAGSELEAAESTHIPEPAIEWSPEPPAELSAETEPPIELASDIILGLPSDEPAPAAERPAEAEPKLEPLAPASATSSEPTAAETDHEPAPGTTDEVFVTETMANLYVQQGHWAGALEIYEKLLAHDPGDERLHDRVREIKEHIYGKAHETVWEPEPLGNEMAPAAASAGPTIREFLRRVIARRAEESSSEEAVARAEPEVAPPDAASSETVTGSIDALFANAAPSEADRSAADALAHAFGEWPEPTPIRGVPAHEASSELSLDHVFKANAPVPRREDADAFSFDQFFSDELGEGAGGDENKPGGEPAERGKDIAQFNAWLNGLKKT